jgi:hypothetical protein
MDCDWIFINLDRSRQKATLNEPTLPTVGNGKHHGSKGYEVAVVITGRTTTPNPAVIAFEFPPRSGA